MLRPADVPVLLLTTLNGAKMSPQAKQSAASVDTLETGRTTKDQKSVWFIFKALAVLRK